MTEQVSFGFSDIYFEGVISVREADLGVNAHVLLTVGNSSVFEEIHVPVVELSAQLDEWIRSGANWKFQYNSIEAEDCLFEFTPVGDSYVEVSSSWNSEGITVGAIASRAGLVVASGLFVSRVVREVREEFGLELPPFVAYRGPRPWERPGSGWNAGLGSESSEWPDAQLDGS